MKTDSRVSLKKCASVVPRVTYVRENNSWVKRSGRTGATTEGQRAVVLGP